ncbi:MAG: sensor histidine kinase [Vallitaleaceae bacterium]|jgi:two-component system sensor histidine kinase YesM|nr:sensor histidine kinase [Vallitaleaceae bacterium]
MKNYSITKKVLIIFLTLTLSIILTSFIATITGANYLLKDTSINYTSRLVGQVESSISEYFKNMENISEAILADKDIIDYIKIDSDNEQACIEVLDFAVDTRNDITNIFVMKVLEDKSLEIISNDRTKQINSFAHYTNASWYTALIENGENMIITSSYVQNLIEDQYNWVISLGVAIKDTDNQTIGVILIDLNYSTIENILNNVMPKDQGYIYLLSDDGQIVYHPSQQLIFYKVKEENVSPIANIHNGHVQIGNRVYLVVDSGLLNWKTVAVIDSTVVYRNTVTNTILFSIIAVVFIIISIYISFAFSNWFTKPIKNLSRNMRKVEQGDLSVRVDIISQDEIGVLGVSFNVMTKKLESLVQRIVVEQEEKRNYELNALRAQINPHFLYNTLDSIIWMAECKENDKVVVMTSALSKMLRASINNQASGVTLQLELQNAENYLKIQKFRYSNKLDYEIDVDVKLYAKKAAHLVLQPLVENSIYHGIKNKEGVSKITIKAFEKNGLLYIQVIDNGVGMDQEKIDLLFADTTQSNVGIGISNINRRISLIYGEQYGLSITSEVGVGTTNTIVIPSIDSVEGGDDLYENKYI